MLGLGGPHRTFGLQFCDKQNSDNFKKTFFGKAACIRIKNEDFLFFSRGSDLTTPNVCPFVCLFVRHQIVKLY